MNIIILGPQGSGKGTQAELIVEKFNLFYFESGSFLREIAKTNKIVDSIVNRKGELLPDGIIFSLMSQRIEENVPERDGILFDGYPRSVKQYELLKDWLGEKDQRINFAILLTISEEESIKRLSSRLICKKCGTIYNLITNPPKGKNCKCGGSLYRRKDDEPQVVKERLALYRKTTEPLVEVLTKEGILIKVDGEQPIDKIFTDIKGRLEKYHGK